MTPALVRHVPGDPDLRGARRDMALEHLPVGGDGAGWRVVQAAAGGEGDSARVGEPRPQQARLAFVVADDHRLTRGQAFFHERDDQRGEFGVGAVEPGLVEPSRLARDFRAHPGTLLIDRHPADRWSCRI
jgi:hypothetical protein